MQAFFTTLLLKLLLTASLSSAYLVHKIYRSSSSAPSPCSTSSASRHFRLHLSDEKAADTTANQKYDLTGHTLNIIFDGFNMNDMSAQLSLQDKFKVKYGGGISSHAPGFWRCVAYDDGREVVECTHPISPEYMLFFDIWEPSILWRGTIDMKNKKIFDGEVITNKKKFGIFPYTETLATFKGDIIPPGEAVPEIPLPSPQSISLLPPKGFETPYDMAKFPEIFSKEFADWWFECEDKLANGLPPPPRPKPFFTPDRPVGSSSSSESNEGGGFKNRSSGKAALRDEKSRLPPPPSNNAFGKKK